MYLQPIIQLASASNFICDHTGGSCHKYCFLRQNRSCQLLAKALEKIYEVDVSKDDDERTAPLHPVSSGDAKRPSVTRVCAQFVKSARPTLICSRSHQP